MGLINVHCATPTDLKVNKGSRKFLQTSREETLGYYLKYLAKEQNLQECSSEEALKWRGRDPQSLNSGTAKIMAQPLGSFYKLQEKNQVDITYGSS